MSDKYIDWREAMKLYATTRELSETEVAFSLHNIIPRTSNTILEVDVDTNTTGINNIIKQAAEQIKTLTGKTAHYDN